MIIDLEFDSERLTFRPLASEDLDLSLEVWANPNVTRYVGGPFSPEEVIEQHPISMRRCGQGCIGVWVLTTKSENEKIGGVFLLPMPTTEEDTDWDLVVGENIPDCEIEIGFTLKETKWGKGYATEACKRLLKFAFEESPLIEIVAVIDEENIASQRVLLKSGLCSQGLIDAYGEKCPGFRISKQQWENEN